VKKLLDKKCPKSFYFYFFAGCGQPRHRHLHGDDEPEEVGGRAALRVHVTELALLQLVPILRNRFGHHLRTKNQIWFRLVWVGPCMALHKITFNPRLLLS
jgi:hypothetical protein